jgi:hypothetical protein
MARAVAAERFGILVKWHETFLGLKNSHSPRKASWDGNIRQGSVSCQDQLALAPRRFAEAASFYDARRRAALRVRAASRRRGRRNGEKRRQCHSCQDPFLDTSTIHVRTLFWIPLPPFLTSAARARARSVLSRPIQSVKLECREAGFSLRTRERAAHNLGLLRTREYGMNMWSLPSAVNDSAA